MIGYLGAVFQEPVEQHTEIGRGFVILYPSDLVRVEF